MFTLLIVDSKGRTITLRNVESVAINRFRVTAKNGERSFVATVSKMVGTAIQFYNPTKRSDFTGLNTIYDLQTGESFGPKINKEYFEEEEVDVDEIERSIDEKYGKFKYRDGN